MLARCKEASGADGWLGGQRQWQFFRVPFCSLMQCISFIQATFSHSAVREQPVEHNFHQVELYLREMENVNICLIPETDHDCL